jgi:hypothetical protein
MKAVGVQYNAASVNGYPLPHQRLHFPAASLHKGATTAQLEQEGAWIEIADPFSPHLFKTIYKQLFGHPRPLCKNGCGAHVVPDVSADSPMSGWNVHGPREAIDRRCAHSRQTGYDDPPLSWLCQC